MRTWARDWGTEVLFSLTMVGGVYFTLIGVITTHVVEVFVMADIVNHNFHAKRRALIAHVREQRATKRVS